MRIPVLSVLFALLVAAHLKCVCRSNEDEWNSYRIKVGETFRFINGQPLPGTKRCHDDADFFHLINGTWFAIPQKKNIRKRWAGVSENFYIEKKNMTSSNFSFETSSTYVYFSASAIQGQCRLHHIYRSGRSGLEAGEWDLQNSGNHDH